MTLLWHDGVDAGPDPDVQAYLAGDDVRLDRHLFQFDIAGTIAHVRGLAQIGLLTGDDETRLVDALEDLRARAGAGVFVLDERFEDGHSAIETDLAEQLGDLGRRVHVGRSRNDQVLTAMRLWMLDVVAGLRADTLRAARACLARARGDAMTPMPGYTHLQRAVPSSVGLWMAAYAEGFLDDAHLLDLTAAWLDASPLGAAAGYGVNLPLARTHTAQTLGFTRLHVNPLHAQHTRGLHEVQLATACWQITQTIRRLAWDLSLYTTSEFGFVRLPSTHTTGSSIMPNKRNPDIVELMRTAAARVAGRIAELQSMLSLPSGYHRDVQDTKRAIVEAATVTQRTIALVPDLIRSLEFERERMAEAISPETFATDHAVDAAVDGVAFRDAYRAAKDDHSGGDAAASLERRISPGACGNLMLDQIDERLRSMESCTLPA